MARWARLFGALALAAGLAVPGIAAAADAGAGDAAAIHTLIQSQIDAFRRDDGTAAYGYASPAIKNIFPTVDDFMAMVRQQYQPVYRPRSLTFGPLMGTMMACPGVMDQEHAFLTALEAVRSWRIEGQHLELLDEQGEPLLRLEARAFP